MIFLVLLSCSQKEESPQTEAEFYQEHNQMLRDNAQRVKALFQEDFNFKGLEFIYVDFGKVYYSFWGHALIRFVGSGKNANEDLTLSFIADFNDYNLDNWKAYFGGYEVLTIIKPLSDYMDEYIKGESRQMYRYILLADREEQSKFLEIIRAWIKDTKLAGPYTFRVNNCSGLMMKSLHQAGISPIKDYETYPFDMAYQFYEKNMIILPPLELDYDKNIVLDESLYLPCDNCSSYVEKAKDYFSKKELDKYYNFKEKKSPQSLSIYPVRFTWWAIKLSKLLLD